MCRTTTRSRSSSPVLRRPRSTIRPISRSAMAPMCARRRSTHDTGIVQRGALHGGRRYRHGHQPDDRRGPGAWRPRAGHRPGAARAHASTKRGAAPLGLVHRLRDAARRRPARTSPREFDESQPCTHNPLGAKGCGESGTIGAPAAVMSAVLDALRRSVSATSRCRRPLIVSQHNPIQEINSGEAGAALSQAIRAVRA